MLSEPDKRLLAEFVDREKPLKRFCDMLESPDKHIMVVWGESGIGKTSLLLRMMHECAQRKLAKSEIVCKDTRANGYLDVMRKIRDDANVDCFTAFTDLVNYLTDSTYRPHFELNINLTTASTISVAAGATISDSTVGDIAGVIIKDNMFVLPRTDMAMPEMERMMRLTERFIDGLRRAVATTPLVVFIDAAEKFSSDTARWLWDELLYAVRDGRLTNLKFVVCGHTAPELDRDWRLLIEEAELKTLRLEHIVAYLAKRNIDEASRETLAKVFFANTKGKISLIAAQVDAFQIMMEEEARASRNDDD